MIEFFVLTSPIKTPGGPDTQYVMTSSNKDGVRTHANALPGVWMPWKPIVPADYLTPEIMSKLTPDDMEQLIILFKRTIYLMDKGATFTCGPLSAFEEKLL